MKPKQAQRRIAEKHIKPSKTITQQIAEGCHSETTQPEKPKPKRQRKHMEMSVYNKLIDQLNDLQSENKRLKKELSKLQEVYQREKAWGIEWYFKANHDPKQDLSIHQILEVDDEIEELEASRDKQKAHKQLYRAACILLTGVAIVLSYYAI